MIDDGSYNEDSDGADDAAGASEVKTSAFPLLTELLHVLTEDPELPRTASDPRILLEQLGPQVKD